MIKKFLLKKKYDLEHRDYFPALRHGFITAADCEKFEEKDARKLALIDFLLKAYE